MFYIYMMTGTRCAVLDTSFFFAWVGGKEYSLTQYYRVIFCTPWYLTDISVDYIAICGKKLILTLLHIDSNIDSCFNKKCHSCTVCHKDMISKKHKMSISVEN